MWTCWDGRHQGRVIIPAPDDDPWGRIIRKEAARGLRAANDFGSGSLPSAPSDTHHPLQEAGIGIVTSGRASSKTSTGEVGQSIALHRRSMKCQTPTPANVTSGRVSKFAPRSRPRFGMSDRRTSSQ